MALQDAPHDSTALCCCQEGKAQESGEKNWAVAAKLPPRIHEEKPGSLGKPLSAVAQTAAFPVQLLPPDNNDKTKIHKTQLVPSLPEKIKPTEINEISKIFKYKHMRFEQVMLSLEKKTLF